MVEPATGNSNFSFLAKKQPELVPLGRLAEKYFPDDPNTAILKARQFAEMLAQLTAARIGIDTSVEEPQVELIKKLWFSGIVPKEITDLFHSVRKSGNAAVHALTGNHAEALSMLKCVWQLALWHFRTFHQPEYKSGSFVPPQPPKDPTLELRFELQRLKNETEADKIALASQLEALKAQVAATAAVPSDWTEPAQKAAVKVVLDEPATRALIDQQLRDAGWEADTVNLTQAKGARPEKSTYRAIAEWPTKTGPADYALFFGTTLLAVVEAKRATVDVSSSLTQAERYNNDLGAPFVFATNGRPYIPQLKPKSGIWFRDARSPDNLPRPLEGWYTPQGLDELAHQKTAQANSQLKVEPCKYGFDLRPYQISAIQAVEGAIADQQREILLAMATGTGKTKTCIVLIYRLLKTQRFHRILFLVDRSALGEQAADAFQDTRMEGLSTFANVFGLKGLDDATPDKATKVHIATVQGMVQRVLYSDEPPPVDQYDCIIIDECHRGYLLDRELSDTEMAFRDFGDYVSKYRRVVEYFDAVKIGLTATPALHTTQIFGGPVYTYTYREAVIDGYLVDYEPPYQIATKLSSDGISWKGGETVQVYLDQSQQIDTITLPDEVHLEVESFNRKVITESFNRVVCEVLSQEIDPTLPQKTLIFCATDEHADLVVQLLKQAFADVYGSVDNNAVAKITGSVDKPLHAIRRYKNEALPNVAVTVDLLTTGVDVPEICTLVFLRRVNSRILFEQMLGRATRLCNFAGVPKVAFRVFDAVHLFDDLKDFTTMVPVVVDPNISFTQLEGELTTVVPEAVPLVRDQFLAKLQGKKRHLDADALDQFEIVAGKPVAEFVAELKAFTPEQVAKWFVAHPGLGELLDRAKTAIPVTRYISEHPDELREVTRGYGKADKPEDYLAAFEAYIQSHRNELPALFTITTKPRELTRADLRSLMVELDRQGFSETKLDTAYKQLSNQDLAARIVGHLRRAALGSPLVPYDVRVDQALAKLLAQKAWTSPQKEWLKKIAAQTKANLWVDRAYFDDTSLMFQQLSGGFDRLNQRLFEGQLTTVLDDFHESLWSDHA